MVVTVVGRAAGARDAVVEQGHSVHEVERQELKLSRLLPPEDLTLEEQVRMTYEQYLR